MQLLRKTKTLEELMRDEQRRREKKKKKKKEDGGRKNKRERGKTRGRGEDRETNKEHEEEGRMTWRRPRILQTTMNVSFPSCSSGHLAVARNCPAYCLASS
jgi:hypothetical protein